LATSEGTPSDINLG